AFPGDRQSAPNPWQTRAPPDSATTTWGARPIIRASPVFGPKVQPCMWVGRQHRISTITISAGPARANPRSSPKWPAGEPGPSGLRTPYVYGLHREGAGLPEAAHRFFELHRVGTTQLPNASQPSFRRGHLRAGVCLEGRF